MTHTPAGPEREVTARRAFTLDGAPISYIVTLSAVVMALAAVPLSVVISSGKSFPLSQGIYPLVGWLLGPVAGAAANGVGATLGVVLAPHTTTLPLATITGAALGGLAAGSMGASGPRRRWGLGVGVLGIIAYLLYAGRAVAINGAEPLAVLAGSFINWSALLLYLLPTRALCARWLADPNLKRVSLGLFGGTWMVAGLTHLFTATLIYLNSNWPNAAWWAFAPFAPWENLLRSLVGAAIGAGVIAGLRRIGLVKSEHARY